MSLTVLEGPDYVGKTTYCKQKYEDLAALGEKVVYVHFPIKSIDDFCFSRDIDVYFMCLKSLKGKSQSEIQDIILENIIDNSELLKKLYLDGFHVIIDRFIFSNYVYRKIICNENINLSFYTKNELIRFILDNARINILSEEENVLLKRKYENTHNQDLLASITEEDEVLKKSNLLFLQLSKYNK